MHYTCICPHLFLVVFLASSVQKGLASYNNEYVDDQQPNSRSTVYPLNASASSVPSQGPATTNDISSRSSSQFVTSTLMSTTTTASEPVILSSSEDDVILLTGSDIPDCFPTEKSNKRRAEWTFMPPAKRQHIFQGKRHPRPVPIGKFQTGIYTDQALAFSFDTLMELIYAYAETEEDVQSLLRTCKHMYNYYHQVDKKRRKPVFWPPKALRKILLNVETMVDLASLASTCWHYRSMLLESKEKEIETANEIVTRFSLLQQHSYELSRRDFLEATSVLALDFVQNLFLKGPAELFRKMIYQQYLDLVISQRQASDVAFAPLIDSLIEKRDDPAIKRFLAQMHFSGLQDLYFSTCPKNELMRFWKFLQMSNISEIIDASFESISLTYLVASTTMDMSLCLPFVLLCSQQKFWTFPYAPLLLAKVFGAYSPALIAPFIKFDYELSDEEKKNSAMVCRKYYPMKLNVLWRPCYIFSITGTPYLCRALTKVSIKDFMDLEDSHHQDPKDNAPWFKYSDAASFYKYLCDLYVPLLPLAEFDILLTSIDALPSHFKIKSSLHLNVLKESLSNFSTYLNVLGIETMKEGFVDPVLLGTPKGKELFDFAVSLDLPPEFWRPLLVHALEAPPSMMLNHILAAIPSDPTTIQDIVFRMVKYPYNCMIKIASLPPALIGSYDDTVVFSLMFNATVMKDLPMFSHILRSVFPSETALMFYDSVCGPFAAAHMPHFIATLDAWKGTVRRV